MGKKSRRKTNSSSSHQESIAGLNQESISGLNRTVVAKMDVLSFADQKACMHADLDAYREGKKNRKAKKKAMARCAGCKKELGESHSLRCSRCKVTRYCGRDCQRSHWKSHKAECGTLTYGIKLTKPCRKHRSFRFSKVSEKLHTPGTYGIPDGVRPDEKFVVKVQQAAMSPILVPILVYDESRTCHFCIEYGGPGFKEVSGEITKETAWNGCKTFMKASFDKFGDCTIYPSTAGVKGKYTW